MVLIPVFLAGLILWSLTLRAQVARRTRELRLANDKLRQLDQMKSNFVSHVSHEFKNPLFTIQDAIGIVLNGEVGGINEKQKQMLEFAKKNADRMLRLVTDLLDLSRIEAGKMQLRKERIDMAPFLEEAMAGREMDVSKKGLTLRKDISCEAGAVTGDRDKLTQVIVNLLSNAIKYTPSGGTITVRATGDEDEARLEVSDTGPGIAKEDIDRLFDKFERITAENQEGTGLGLAISRDIINLHKGKIWVESEPGKGARFIITLPRG
jgi:signal transduction histidine kinase